MIAEAPTSPATEDAALCHCPDGSASGQCSTPSSLRRSVASSLPLIALALLNPTNSYEDIAKAHNITVDDLLAFLTSEELQQHLANIAALQALRHQQALAAATARAIARLEHISETSEDPVEQRRAATAITRAARPTHHQTWHRAPARCTGPVQSAPQRTSSSLASPSSAPEPANQRPAPSGAPRIAQEEAEARAITRALVDTVAAHIHCARAESDLDSLAPQLAPQLLDPDAPRAALLPGVRGPLARAMGFAPPAEVFDILNPAIRTDPQTHVYRLRFHFQSKPSHDLLLTFSHQACRWLIQDLRPHNTS